MKNTKLVSRIEKASMEMSVTTISPESVIRNGEYLGFCDQKKGYVYSVPRGYTSVGRRMYTIVIIKNGECESLLNYNAAQ